MNEEPNDGAMRPETDEEDVDAHGLREGLVVALAAGSLAAPSAAAAYPTPDDPGAGRAPAAAQAGVERAPTAKARTQAKKGTIAKKGTKAKKATRHTSPTGFAGERQPGHQAG